MKNARWGDDKRRPYDWGNDEGDDHGRDLESGCKQGDLPDVAEDGRQGRAGKSGASAVDRQVECVREQGEVHDAPGKPTEMIAGILRFRSISRMA